MPSIRIVYFGTPEYAVPALRALQRDARFEIALVVTQPDRPAGRGHRLVAPPVKTAALELGLSVYQPESLRLPEQRQPLVTEEADLFVVAAFGLIFGEKTLAMPKRGAVNLHASILPAYRGANPIAAAILNGEPETGVSLMVMERGLDTGPVIATRSIPIEATDTTASLTGRLADLAADLLIDEIGGYLDGSVMPVPQTDEAATLTRPMRKSDGEIDWRAPAELIERQVRAMWPWPRAWSRLGSAVVQLHAVRAVDSPSPSEPGTIRVAGRAVIVACGEGAIELVTIQFPGKSAVAAGAAVAGGFLGDGMRFEPVSGDREPLVTPIRSGPATSV